MSNTAVQLSPEQAFEDIIAKESNRNKVRTVNRTHKILSTEDYAQEFYNLVIGAPNTVPLNPIIGNKYTGKIVGKVGNELALDIGAKDDVYVELRGVELKAVRSIGTELSIGQEIPVVVVEIVAKTDSFRGSVAKAINISLIETAEEMANTRTSVTAVVTSWNNGGYVLTSEISGSHIEMFMPNIQAGVNKVTSPEEMVGETMEVIIDGYSEERNQFYASRKKYLETLIPEEIGRLDFNSTVYNGFVTGTTSFGVFVEFNGCLTGMIHKSNLHPDYVDTMHEIQPGTPVEFYVKEVVKDSRIILTQVLRESIWDTVKTFQKLTGKVIDNRPFGALIHLDDETRGLIHSSELEKHGRTLTPGQQVNVKVLAVNRSERKIYLTLV